MEEVFLSFLIILSAGLFFSEIFRRLHLPYVTALIIGGIVIGPLGLNMIRITEALSFFGAIGVIFLMLMAGMEIKVEMLTKTAICFHSAHSSGCLL
jgi:Kef-type K+ transport system membrane component KefB